MGGRSTDIADGTETPENIWELDPEDAQKGLLEADFPFGSVNLNSTGSQKTRNALAKERTQGFSTGRTRTSEPNSAHSGELPCPVCEAGAECASEPTATGYSVGTP